MYQLLNWISTQYPEYSSPKSIELKTLDGESFYVEKWLGAQYETEAVSVEDLSAPAETPPLTADIVTTTNDSALAFLTTTGDVVFIPVDNISYIKVWDFEN